MSTERKTPPFRADHVGSLLRPPALLQARRDHAAGRLDADRLREVEDEAIRSVVAMQERVGLRAATDGELRRDSWHLDFLSQLDGVRRVKAEAGVTWHGDDGDLELMGAATRVDAPVGLSHTIFGDDFAALRRLVSHATPKLTIPSPSMLHYRGGRASIDEAVYPDLDAFWADVVAAYREEVRRLGAAGCTYLQFDDTSFAYLNDPRQRAEIERLGGDGARQHETYLAHLNEVLAARPDGMSVTTHMCRGNFRSSWVAEGSYDYVAEALFNELDVDGFFMEWDDERSGGFEPLRFVPKGKVVVLGLVTTKRPQLESVDALKRRIEEAARHLDVDQLCLSPQCGFASSSEGNALTAAQQEAKLQRVVETAAEVWA